MSNLYNKMQSKFLSDILLINISEQVAEPIHYENNARIQEKGLSKRVVASAEFEMKGNDVLFSVKTVGSFFREEMRDWLNELQHVNGEPIRDQTYKGQKLTHYDIAAYVDAIGYGTPLPAIYTGTTLEYNVMIVPSIGDDYPAVLRKINERRLPGYNPLVYFIEYTGQMDFNTVCQIYLQTGVRLFQCTVVKIE